MRAHSFSDSTKILCVVGLLSVVNAWSSCQCHGQANQPFGSPADLATPGTIAPPVGSTSSLPLTDPHPVVASLRSNPPRTPVEIGKAILYMKRIERWKEAAYYLDELAKQNMDAGAAVKTIRATGLETWLDLENRTEELSKEQIATVRRVIDGASQATRNPIALAEAIRFLNNTTSLADRKRGVMAIQAAGEDGLAALMQSIAATDTAPPPIVSELIVTMGKSGDDALKAAIATPHDSARPRFIEVAARIPGASYIPEISSGLFSVSTESAVHASLTKSLSPAGQALPSIATVQNYLVNAMKSELAAYKAISQEPSSRTKTVWRWNAEGKSMVAELDSEAGWHLERAYQLAELLLHLPQQSMVDAGLAQAISLQRHFHLVPVIDYESATSIRKVNTRAVELPKQWESLLIAALDTAEKQSLAGAQLRLLQLATALKANASVPSDTLRTSLASSLQSSVPAIRYQAALTVKDFGIENANATHRLAFQTVNAELKKLEGKSLAVVVGGATERCDGLTTQLNQLAMRSLVFSNARDTLRFVQGAEPIEMIFIVDRVLEMKLYELIQRLRTSPRLKAIPIVVMTDIFSAADRALVKSSNLPEIEYGVLTTRLETTESLLQTIRQNSTIPQLDSIDRLTFRTLAETKP
jgi:CheY-like chemotaxis protein